MVRCPAHDDRRASLHVTKADDGKVLLTCHADERAALVDSITEAVTSRLSDKIVTRTYEQAQRDEANANDLLAAKVPGDGPRGGCFLVPVQNPNTFAVLGYCWGYAQGEPIDPPPDAEM